MWHGLAGPKLAKSTGKFVNRHRSPSPSGLRRGSLRSLRFSYVARACRAEAREASEGWWARQDSNLQPDRYERPALTIELQAPPRSGSRNARPATVRGSFTGMGAGVQCWLSEMERATARKAHARRRITKFGIIALCPRFARRVNGSFPCLSRRFSNPLLFLESSTVHGVVLRLFCLEGANLPPPMSYCLGAEPAANPPRPRRTPPPCATSRSRPRPACRTRRASSASGCRRSRSAARSPSGPSALRRRPC